MNNCTRFFTQEQIDEIRRRLAVYGTKDSQFEEADYPLSGTEKIAIVQNGRNKLSSVDEFKIGVEIDEEPTEDSNNLARSGGIFNYINSQISDYIENHINEYISKYGGITKVIPITQDDLDQLQDKANKLFLIVNPDTDEEDSDYTSYKNYKVPTFETDINIKVYSDDSTYTNKELKKGDLLILNDPAFDNAKYLYKDRKIIIVDSLQEEQATIRSIVDPYAHTDFISKHLYGSTYRRYNGLKQGEEQMLVLKSMGNVLDYIPVPNDLLKYDLNNDGTINSIESNILYGMMTNLITTFDGYEYRTRPHSVLLEKRIAGEYDDDISGWELTGKEVNIDAYLNPEGYTDDGLKVNTVINGLISGNEGTIMSITFTADENLLSQSTLQLKGIHIKYREYTEYPDRYTRRDLYLSDYNVNVVKGSTAPSPATITGDNVLYIDDFNITPGNQVTVNVCLNNSIDYIDALDFSIYLPSGLYIAQGNYQDNYEYIFSVNSQRSIQRASIAKKNGDGPVAADVTAVYLLISYIGEQFGIIYDEEEFQSGLFAMFNPDTNKIVIGYNYSTYIDPNTSEEQIDNLTMIILDPSPNVIYCNSFNSQLYRWNSNKQEMVPVNKDLAIAPVIQKVIAQYNLNWLIDEKNPNSEDAQGGYQIEDSSSQSTAADRYKELWNVIKNNSDSSRPNILIMLYGNNVIYANADNLESESLSTSITVRTFDGKDVHSWQIKKRTVDQGNDTQVYLYVLPTGAEVIDPEDEPQPDPDPEPIEP